MSVENQLFTKVKDANVDIFLREAGRPFYFSDGGIVEGLYVAIRATNRQILLWSCNHEQEMNEIVSAIRLLHDYGGKGCAIVAATSHPTWIWRQQMQESGENYQWAVPHKLPPHAWHPEDVGAIDIQTVPCQFLNAFSDRESTISVCGIQNNHLVLAIHHFQRWCLTNPAICPYFKTYSMKDDHGGS
ncbi:MAG: hypothetical protein HQL80_07010 [Magnetococcales bacterium]|nr:hypothetical protein [Magnetococcales bacterium]